MLKKRLNYLLFFCMVAFLNAHAIDNKGITFQQISSERFTIIDANRPLPLLVDKSDNIAVNIAAENLSKDFERVCGKTAKILEKPDVVKA